ncbi:sulfate adenylyltransferase subunit CysN [Alsobacter sp. SYSU BS001988]
MRAAAARTAPLPIAAAEPQNARGLLRFITCGSVDDGKSTLIGRLLYDSRQVHEDQLEALGRDSRRFGTQGEKLDLALLVDGLSAEREQGITIDVAYRYFATPRRTFIVADAPGHEQYTRNMATGASTADCAVVLVDARKGVLPQTRRHSFIVSMLGVRQVILAVNKMDLVGYDQAVFDAIAADYRTLAAGLGFDGVAAVPLSALEGDNVATRSSAMPWHAGPSVLETLENVDAAASAAPQARFRFPVQWVNRPNLDFRGFAGTISGGSVAPGDEVAVLPGGRRSRVARIVTQDGDLPEAVAGQAVTLTLADEIDVSRGDVLVSVDESLSARKAFAARVLWMAERPLRRGEELQLRLSAATATARVTVLGVTDIHTFRSEPADALALNAIGLTTIALDRPVVLADYRDDRELGAFILVDKVTGDTVALGLVDSRASALAQVPADGAASELTARPAWTARLASRVAKQRWRLVEEASWRILGALAVGTLAQATVGDWRITAAAALAEGVARPILRGVHQAAWRASEQRRLARAELDAEGSGI